MSLLGLRFTHRLLGFPPGNGFGKRCFYFVAGSWIALFSGGGGICESPAFAEPQNTTWESANTAGMQAYRQGRFSDAKQWFMQALTEAERSGEPSPSQAMTLNNLAAAHEALGENREAELRYQQSLSVIEAIQGPNHPDLVPGLKNLALLYVQSGKFQQAEPLLKRSLSILETHLGSTHAHLIPSLMALAQLAQSQSRFGEAEHYYTRALTIADSNLPSDHQQIATILIRYATLLRQMNRNEEASLLEERAKAIKGP